MTIEDAIRILSPNSESRLVRAIDGFLPTQKVLCALEMAISALRAQQTPLDRSRWEGCMCCEQYDEEKFRVGGLNVNYCMFCGRPLTEAAWAELERRISGE